MKPHTLTHVRMYGDHKGGGLTDVAHIQFIGYTLVENGDLARLRQIASCMDADPIPSNIVDVFELCLKALRKQKTFQAQEARDAVRDILKATT